MYEADRRIAEMDDAGFDPNRAPQPRQPGCLQGELERRKTSSLGLEIGTRCTDRRERLDAGGGEPVDKRRESEISIRFEVHRFDAIARRRNEPFEGARFGSALDGGTRPGHKTPADRLVDFTRRSRSGNVKRLLDPGGDFAIRRVDKLMTEAK